jgi:PEP-CTERM motif
MKRQLRIPLGLGIAVALLLTTADGARADIITDYNNFNAGQNGGYGYNPLSSWLVGGDGSINVAVGQVFTAKATGTLDQITLALDYFSTGTNQGTISFRSDNGGVPGTVLENFKVSGLPTANGGLLPPTTVTDVRDLMLTAGTNYWVVVFTAKADNLAWMWNDTGAMGPQADSFTGGTPPWGTSLETAGAFSVTEVTVSDPDPVPVPEPPTLALLSLGGLALAGWRRWKKRATV